MGADHCGTNSLRRNLEAHPELRILWGPAFLQHDHVLPYRAEAQALLRAFGAGRLRGFHEPLLYRHGRLREAARRMPNASAVLVVCDPLGRFEKIFWQSHLCCPGGGAPGRGRAGAPCWRTLREALDARAADFEGVWALSHHVLEVQRLLGAHSRGPPHARYSQSQRRKVGRHRPELRPRSGQICSKPPSIGRRRARQLPS